MILIYVVVLLLLGLIKLLIWRRTLALETKYVRLSKRAKELASQPNFKAGNGSGPRDTYQHAKKQYELGRVVGKRDAVEQKYVRWQARCDGVDKKMSALTKWRGRTVPYLLGAIDVVLVLATLHVLGLFSHVSPDKLEQWLRTM